MFDVPFFAKKRPVRCSDRSGRDVSGRGEKQEPRDNQIFNEIGDEKASIAVLTTRLGVVPHYGCRARPASDVWSNTRKDTTGGWSTSTSRAESTVRRSTEEKSEVGGRRGRRCTWIAGPRGRWL